MPDFHFIEDYEQHVAELLRTHSLDDAMSLAVGGDYEEIGKREAEILKFLGLRDEMALLDFGCGSGRLAWAIGDSVKIDYLGIDIIQSLLNYAASRSPPHYRFALNRELTLPTGYRRFDLIACFSVFTHLMQSESYIYLEQMADALTPGGKIIISFLEFSDPSHWPIFAATVAQQRGSTLPHLNMFLERSTIDIWASRVGLRRETFIDGFAAPWGTAPLGQSIAVLART